MRRSVSCWLVLALAPAWGCERAAAPRPAGGVPAATIAFAAPPFADITRSAGLDFVHQIGAQRQFFFPEIMAAGGALLDFDGDGDLDVYLINSGAPPSAAGESSGDPAAVNRLFRQDEGGRFTDVTQASGLGDAGYGMGVAVGDVNNDGHVDVYVTNYGPDRLYQNRGDGTFADITQQAGIDNDRWSASAAFFDYDRDGWLDLFVTNYVDYLPLQPCHDAAGRLDYCNPAAFPRTADTLYRNVTGSAEPPSEAGAAGRPRATRFADVSLDAGIAARSGAGLGVLCADLNGDRWIDVYVANDGHANRLWINQQDGSFRDEAVVRGAAYDMLGRGQASMGVAAGDFNHDGLLDLLLTHLEGENNAMYLSSGTTGFRESSVTVGLSASSLAYTGFGVAFLDIEHDGDEDLAVVNGRVRRTVAGGEDGSRGAASGADPLAAFVAAYAEPNQMFVNDGRGRFRRVQAPGDAFAEPAEVSRGLACGDVDNDGDIDLLVTNMAGRARLFRNDAVKQGHWLSIRAVDPRHGGRDAYGAQITVRAGQRRWLRLVGPGSSYLASHDPRVHVGLGDAAQFDAVDVLWPDGLAETFAAGPADRFLVLRRGEGSGS